MATISAQSELLFILVLAAGFFMAWGIGANDLSNSMGPAVGGRVFTIKEAVIIAAVFEVAGAVFYGVHVTTTLRTQIIDLSGIANNSHLLFYGMLSSLVGAALWLTFASAFGWPVSTTHSIIGAMVGFGIVGIGADAIRWDDIGGIAIGWVVSPLAGGIIAFLLMKSIQVLILNASAPVQRAKRWGPYYIFLAGFAVAMVILFKGMSFLPMKITTVQSLLISSTVGLGLLLIGLISFSRLRSDGVEEAFSPIIIFTACALAFAHGANDVANGVGPLAVALGAFENGQHQISQTALPMWLFLFGGAGIVVGLATFGFRVVDTIGRRITFLSPCRAFCVCLAAAGTVVVASRLGMPVSTTHIVVGAVLGVGLAQGFDAVNWKIVRVVVLAWVITIPAAGLLTTIVYFAIGRTLEIPLSVSWSSESLLPCLHGN